MDWNVHRVQGARVWTNVRNRAATVRSESPWHVKLVAFLTTTLILGLLAILAVLGLAVGIVVVTLIAAYILIRRAWRALVGGFTSPPGPQHEGRRNVRVIQRPDAR